MIFDKISSFFSPPEKAPQRWIIPNCDILPDDIKNLCNYKIFYERNMIAVCGHDGNGNPVFLDIETAPSVLIAGGTGSGKSVQINLILYELLAKNSPDMLTIFICDPKKVDYAIYKGIPHIKKYADTPETITATVKQIERLMMARYEKMQTAGVRNIMDLQGYPQVLLIFDELAAIRVKPCLETLENIARLGRAAGVHMILATQNPKTSGSDQNLSSTLKANCPSKIAFRVDNIYNSRAILDIKGAELLNGCGDGLVRTAGKNLVRFQGGFISDNDIKKICDFWSGQPVDDDPEKIRAYKGKYF